MMGNCSIFSVPLPPSHSFLLLLLLSCAFPLHWHGSSLGHIPFRVVPALLWSSFCCSHLVQSPSVSPLQTLFTAFLKFSLFLIFFFHRGTTHIADGPQRKKHLSFWTWGTSGRAHPVCFIWKHKIWTNGDCPWESIVSCGIGYIDRKRQ